MKLDGALLATVEAAYRIDAGTDEWLQGLVAAARPFMDHGLGVFACVYDVRRAERFRITRAVGDIPITGWPTLFRGWAPHMPPPAVEQTFGTAVAGTISQLLGPGFLDTDPTARAVALRGILDSLGFNGLDPSGRGVGVSAPLPRRLALDPAEADALAKVGAHIATAARLRRELVEGARRAGKAAGTPRDPSEVEATAEAILSPDGVVKHATVATEGVAARAALRTAALAMDRARGRLRRSQPTEALELWGALVAGSWQLVDYFDRDGRRFLVAERAEPEAPGSSTLTRRERQVLAFAALGQSNKLIAYQLGLAPTTVGFHLASAMRKLGVASRVELLRRARRAG